MNAIELNTIAHNGVITVTIPEALRPQWDEKAIRVIVMAIEDELVNPKASLLSSLKQIKIAAPADFSENLDAYLNGEKNA
jgi:hypothetical protein